MSTTVHRDRIEAVRGQVRLTLKNKAIGPKTLALHLLEVHKEHPQMQFWDMTSQRAQEYPESYIEGRTRQFLNGDQGAHGWVLDLYDLALDRIERLVPDKVVEPQPKEVETNNHVDDADDEKDLFQARLFEAIDSEDWRRVSVLAIRADRGVFS